MADQLQGKKNETYRLRAMNCCREMSMDSLTQCFDFYDYSSLKNILIISSYIAG